MKREDKYPMTDTFLYYNANPHNRLDGDCVVRAIANATNQPWDKVLRDLTELGIKYGYMPDSPKTYSRYLEQLGWVKHPQPRQWLNMKYTGAEFCKSRSPREVIIAHIGGHHIVCIRGGRVEDIWDCTGKCIGNYWTNPKLS